MTTVVMHGDDTSLLVMCQTPEPHVGLGLRTLSRLPLVRDWRRLAALPG